MMMKIFGVLCMALLLWGCEKVDQDPDYKFVIIVKTLDDSTRVQNATVNVGVPDAISSDVELIGITDLNGEVHFEYGQDAVFRIIATRGKDPYSYMGCGYVRLEPNEEVYQTIYIEPYNTTFPGCDTRF